MPSVYQLKPQFQSLLRPLVKCLADAGVSANALTLIAMVGSCAIGFLLYFEPDPRLFLLLPPWMLLRMALNAMDGMLAREFNQQTRLGAYLNEIGDVVSDAALLLPFCLVPPFGWGKVGLVIFLATLSEMVGVLGVALGGKRRYDGPMGKSDRALVIGVLGIWLGLAGNLPNWTSGVMPTMSGLLMLTIWNRIRQGCRD